MTLRMVDAPCSNDESGEGGQGARVRFFIEEFCRYPVGERTGERVSLLPWQADIVDRLFGEAESGGRRRHRFLWLESPRKSGKTLLAAGLALYMLMADPEPGAEIIVAAPGRTHAEMWHDLLRRMITLDADLSAVCRIENRAIRYKGGCIRIVTDRQARTAGLDASCVIFDDLHLFQQRYLHDTLIASMAARTQPLTFYLLGAGRDHGSLAWELRAYAHKVLRGTVVDNTWLVRSFGADLDDDWGSEEVWQRAHPGLGTMVSRAFLRQEYEKAEEIPLLLNNFARNYLNIWIEGDTTGLDMRLWDQSGAAPIDMEMLAGRSCFLGLDLSTTSDFSGLALVFPEADGGFTVLPRALCPEQRLAPGTGPDIDMLRRWRDTGYLIVTPGDTISYATIRNEILAMRDTFMIREVAYDPWNATMLVQQLANDGLRCVPVTQSGEPMDLAMRTLNRVLRQSTLRHGGHPVLRQCATNVAFVVNDRGQLKPEKRASKGHIDLISATLNGIYRAIIHDRFSAETV